MSYAPYAPRIAEASVKPQIWRLALGLVLAAILSMMISQMFLASVLSATGDGFAQTIVSGTSAGGLLVLLFAMGAMAVGALVSARVLHDRGPASVFGPFGLALSQGLRVLGAVVALQAVLAALFALGAGDTLRLNLAPSLWLSLLPLGILAVLVQTGAEEVLFRGYLQSQLAARFRHPALYILPQATLFAAGHYAAGTFGSNAMAVALWAGLFGVLAGDLTARSGTLGPAIALHFANNVMAILVVSMDGTLSGLSLFSLPFSPEDEAAVSAALPVDFAGIVVAWLAARVALRR